MRAMALLMITTILVVPLAGCVDSGDGPQFELSSEEIEDLIDANLDDFLNNSSITIINNNFNNTSNNVDQSGTSSSNNAYYNGTSEQNEIFLVHFTFNGTDLFPEIEEKQNNNFTVWFSYYDYATNDDRYDQFTLSCSNYYDAPIPENNSGTAQPYWQDSSSYYWNWWDAIYNNTIRDLLDEMAYNNDVTSNCRYEDNSYNRIFDWDDLVVQDYLDWSLAPIFYSLELERGTGFSFLSSTIKHSYTDGSGDKQDDYTSFGNNAEEDPVGHMWGGWDNLTLTFHLRPNVYTDSVYTFTMYYELYSVTIVD